MVPCLHQSNAYIKRKLRNGELKNAIAFSVQNTYRRLRACKVPGFILRRIQGRRCKFGEIRGYLSPWYRVCTKAMIISKESYRHGEPKNVIAFTVQKTYRRLQACKRSGFMQLRIGPTMKILGNSRLPISMYRICTRAMVIPKRSYGYGEPKYVITLSVQKTYWRL